jgi:hypothetical protein
MGCRDPYVRAIMEIIKNLVKYDTDKATPVCEFDGDEPIFTLYRTDKNNWFTYTERTNDLVPLTEHEAALLLERFCKWDLLEKTFSDLIQVA